MGAAGVRVIESLAATVPASRATMAPGAAVAMAIQRFGAPLASGMVEIRESDLPLRIALAYATEENFIARRVYAQARCALHRDAAACLGRAARAARRAGVTRQVLAA